MTCGGPGNLESTAIVIRIFTGDRAKAGVPGSFRVRSRNILHGSFAPRQQDFIINRQPLERLLGFTNDTTPFDPSTTIKEDREGRAALMIIHP
jgi:hypothetical protein